MDRLKTRDSFYNSSGLDLFSMLLGKTFPSMNMMLWTCVLLLAHANEQLLGFYFRRLTNKLTAFITLSTDITQWQSHDQSQPKRDNFLLHQSTVNQVQFWYLPTLKGLNPLFSTVVLLPTICELSLVLDRKKE